MPLKLAEFDNQRIGTLNQWANEVDNRVEESLQRIAKVREDALAAKTTADASATDVGVPPEITSPSISESGFTLDGVVWSEVTATYTAPSPLDNFAGIFLVAKDYRASAELVKVAEHSFAGAAGGSASFNVQLQRTGETVTFHFVAKNTFGGTREDWSLAPSQTAVLDGNASAPTAPSGLTANQEELGVQLSWTLGTETNLAGYNIHRHTADVFGSSTVIANVAVTKTGNPGYFDKTAGRSTTFFYWVTALNTANQESSQSASASNSGTGVDFSDVEGTTKPEDNATDGADWPTDVTNRPTELTDGRIAAGFDSVGDLVRDVVASRVAEASLQTAVVNRIFASSTKKTNVEGLENAGNFKAGKFVGGNPGITESAEEISGGTVNANGWKQIGTRGIDIAPEIGSVTFDLTVLQEEQLITGKVLLEATNNVGFSISSGAASTPDASRTGNGPVTLNSPTTGTGLTLGLWVRVQFDDTSERKVRGTLSSDKAIPISAANIT